MKTPQEVYKEVLEELGFANCYHNQMTNSDHWMCVCEAMERYAEQKLNLSGIGSKRPQFTLEEITEAIKTQWVKDFGKLMDDDSERDGYFICGFVHEALKAACASEKGGEANKCVGNGVHHYEAMKDGSVKCDYCGHEIRG